MSLTLSFAETISGGGKLEDTTKLIQQVAQFGAGVLPGLGLTFTNGTGNGKCNMWYLAKRTLAGTTMDSLDLAAGLTAFNGDTITFTKIKRILLALSAPDGTLKVRLGPQGVSNAFAGPWSGGVGATVYEDVFWKTDKVHPYGGWTVTAGTGDILAVYNPGATSLDYAILLMGEV